LKSLLRFRVAVCARQQLGHCLAYSIRPVTPTSPLTPLQARAAAWAATGIVALRGAGLTEIPTTALTLGAAVRVLDASGNQLTALPEAFAAFTRLQRLRLSANCLTCAGVPDALFRAIGQNLAVLALDDNRLERLPDAIGALEALKKLTVARNALEQLPTSVRRLRCLELLDVSGNQLNGLPAELGECAALREVDARKNRIAAIPEEWSRLQSLVVRRGLLNELALLDSSAQLAGSQGRNPHTERRY
jgi:Leucine-rich repeat (LRR) protein